MLIQIVLGALILILLAKVLVDFRSRKMSGIMFFMWLSMFSAGLSIVIWPDLASRVAQAVGVGRGSDLIIYIAILVLFYMQIRMFERVYKAEQSLSLIVSKLGVLHAQKGKNIDSK
jgi:hypothetical protein